MKQAAQDRRLASAIQSVFRNTTGLSGQEFFNAITLELGRVLGADFTMIGERTGEAGEQIRSLALANNNAIQAQITYDLTGTPCEDTLSQDICIIPRGAATAYPADIMLADLEIEGYIGICISDQEHNPTGLVIALFHEDQIEENFAQSILLVAASRIGSEMERLALEAQRIELEQRIQKSQKLESLGLLAGGIAHDFNNLLCGILGSAELLNERGHIDAEDRCDVNLIREAAQRGTELCNQLLAYSGRGRFVTAPIDMSEMVLNTKRLLDVSISKNITVNYDLAEDIPAIIADATQIRQVIINLVMNASEAIAPNHGHITIKTAPLDGDDWPRRDALFDANPKDCEYVYLHIVDDGQGMDEATRRQVFDPFFTTKTHGRGLGLAVVLGIVRGHGGDLIIRSQPGRGTSLCLAFPATKKPAVRLEATGSPRAPWQGQGSILLVDDDEQVREVTGRMLEHLGFQVQTASNGIEAIHHIQNKSDSCDLALIDLTMPQMGGIEAMKELKGIAPKLDVILMSGYDDEDISAQESEHVESGFLKKPFKLSDLESTIRAVLG